MPLESEPIEFVEQAELRPITANRIFLGIFHEIEAK